MNVEHGDWFDFVYEDFKSICEILGIELDKYEPCFSGFWSQGDGASFTGDYRSEWSKDAVGRIRQYAPMDNTLHRIADGLLEASKSFPIFARISRRGSYYHEQTMYLSEFEISDDCDEDDVTQEVFSSVEEKVLDCMKDLALWLYGKLEEEYDHLTSDEVVWESLLSNDMVELCDIIEVEADEIANGIYPKYPAHPMLKMALDGDGELWRLEIDEDGENATLTFIGRPDGHTLGHQKMTLDEVPKPILTKMHLLNMLDSDFPTDQVEGVGMRLSANIYYIEG